MFSRCVVVSMWVECSVSSSANYSSDFGELLPLHFLSPEDSEKGLRFNHRPNLERINKTYWTCGRSAALLKEDLPGALLVTLEELCLTRLQMPNNARRLQIRTLLIRSGSHDHDATECSTAKGSAVSSLHVRDQLSHIAVQRNVLVALELLEGAHESGDESLEDGRNHLALCAATQSAAKVRRISTLTACRSQFGSV